MVLERISLEMEHLFKEPGKTAFLKKHLTQNKNSM